MSTIASMLAAPAASTSPAARFTPAGRVAAASTLVLGAGFQLAAFMLEPGGSDDTLDRLRWVADEAARANLAKLCDVLAVPFLLGATIVYVLLSRERSPRLAYVGGTLLGLGLVGLAMVQGYETLEFGIAQDGRFEVSALADAVDDVSTPPAVAIILMLIIGASLGLLMTAVALWRSAAVPRGAVLLIAAFVIIDIPLQMGRLSHAIAFVAACWIAWAVLRAGRPAESSS